MLCVVCCVIAESCGSPAFWCWGTLFELMSEDVWCVVGCVGLWWFCSVGAVCAASVSQPWRKSRSWGRARCSQILANIFCIVILNIIHVYFMIMYLLSVWVTFPAAEKQQLLDLIFLTLKSFTQDVVCSESVSNSFCSSGHVSFLWCLWWLSFSGSGKHSYDFFILILPPLIRLRDLIYHLSSP